MSKRAVLVIAACLLVPLGAARADEDGPGGPRESPSSTAPTRTPPTTTTTTSPSVTPLGEAERRAGIVALERLYDGGRDPELLLALARQYEAAARDGDARDVRLAVLYYERYLVEKPGAERAPIDWAITRLRATPTATIRPGRGVRGANSIASVHFLPYHSDESYDVEAQGKTCKTPCTLELRPGPTTINASGSGALTTTVVLPRLTSQVRLQADGATAFTIAGAVLIPVGLTIAAGMWATGIACGGSNTGCMVANFIFWPVLGVTAFFTGVGLLAAAGSRRPAVDANRPEILESRRKQRLPRLRLTSIAVAPTANGVAGGVSFAF